MLVAINKNKFKWLTLKNTALFIYFAIMKRISRAGFNLVDLTLFGPRDLRRARSNVG